MWNYTWLEGTKGEAEGSAGEKEKLDVEPSNGNQGRMWVTVLKSDERWGDKEERTVWGFGQEKKPQVWRWKLFQMCRKGRRLERAGICSYSDANPLPPYSSCCVMTAGCQFNTPPTGRPTTASYWQKCWCCLDMVRTSHLLSSPSTELDLPNCLVLEL